MHFFLSEATAAEAAATTKTTAAEAASGAIATSWTVASTPSEITAAFVAAIAASSTSEHVVAVTHMQHGIRGDGIDLTVGPTIGVYCAGEVRLLVEDVIPL